MNTTDRIEALLASGKVTSMSLGISGLAQMDPKAHFFVGLNTGSAGRLNGKGATVAEALDAALGTKATGLPGVPAGEVESVTMATPPTEPVTVQTMAMPVPKLIFTPGRMPGT